VAFNTCLNELLRIARFLYVTPVGDTNVWSECSEEGCWQRTATDAGPRRLWRLCPPDQRHRGIPDPTYTQFIHILFENIALSTFIYAAIQCNKMTRTRGTFSIKSEHTQN